MNAQRPPVSTRPHKQNPRLLERTVVSQSPNTTRTNTVCKITRGHDTHLCSQQTAGWVRAVSSGVTGTLKLHLIPVLTPLCLATHTPSHAILNLSHPLPLSLSLSLQKDQWGEDRWMCCYASRVQVTEILTCAVLDNANRSQIGGISLRHSCRKEWSKRKMHFNIIRKLIFILPTSPNK